MITEKSQLQLRIKDAIISLKKYTNKSSSISVKIICNNQELIENKDWRLNFYGDIIIKMEAFDFSKISKSYVDVLVTYEPTKLPVNSIEDINTKEGISRNIKTLKDLLYISGLRYALLNKFNYKEELESFVLNKSIYLDSRGQVLLIEYDNKIYHESRCLPNICSMKDFEEKVKSYTLSQNNFPSYRDVCPHCGEKWTLDNITDCIEGRGDFLYHKYCNLASCYEESKKEFEYVASTVFDDYKLRAVKNNYGSENIYGSWFMIFTNEGRIRIGWRYRVIEIRWMNDYKKFKTDEFNEVAGTKEFNNYERYIHAGSTAMAIKYLRLAKNNIIK